MSRIDVAETLTSHLRRSQPRLTLRQLRERRELSLRALEVLTGIARGTLSQIETGARTPTASELVTLADFYGVSLAECRFITLAMFEVES